jgi:hypothetical protein
MRTSPRTIRLLAAGAATALVVPAAIAFAPSAYAGTVVDTGDASSTATLLSITSGPGLTIQRAGAQGNVTNLGAAHTVKALVATLSASTITNPTSASIDVIPVALDGTSYGEKKVSNGTKAVPANGQGVAGVVGVTTPAAIIQATTQGGPVAKLTSAGNYGATVLGINLPAIAGSVNFGSSVLNKTSDAAKTVHVSNVALPSLTDIFDKFGLDLSRVEFARLKNLVDTLKLNATSAIQAAETTLSNAQADLSDAQDAVDAATTALTNALNAQSTLFSNAAITTLTGLSGTPTAAQWVAFGTTLQGTIETAMNGLTLNSAANITTATSDLDAATAALDGFENALFSAEDALIPLLVGALDVPLLSIGSVTVGTIADAGANHVATVTGSVKGVSVLGTQLIKSTDVLSLGSSALATVQAKINVLTQAVGTFLNNAPLNNSNGSLLKVPTPAITLLQKTTNLNPMGGYQAAYAQVVGAAVSWGALTIPGFGEVGIVKKAARPNLVVNSSGNLVTDPIALTVASLTDQSRYAPAAAVKTPTTVTPGTTPSTTLPQTGVPVGVAVGALLLMLAAFGVRRMRSTAVTDE